MKRCLPSFFLLFLIILGSTGTQSYAEPSPTEILKKATRLTCTFTSEQQTRWGSTGPIKDEGLVQYYIIFDSINHQTGEGKIKYETYREYFPVRIRNFANSMTFFELTRAGEIDPVITTVLDDYYMDTTKFIAVRSEHVTSSFQRALALQSIGACVPGK